MSRSGRLFLLMDAMRAKRVPVTAAQLAQQLGVSERTIYRDIQTLAELGAPLQGEAGIGYVLDSGFDMPPLMLTSDEIEAAVLGAQWVASRGDPALARAARDLVAKIAASVPERLRPVVLEPSVTSGPTWAGAKEDRLDMAQVRTWIRSGRKLTLDYRDEQDRASLRTVWPFLIGYRETVRLLIAWCETRQDFRTFRTDRVVEATFLDDRYPERPARLRTRWQAKMDEEHRRYLESKSPLP